MYAVDARAKGGGNPNHGNDMGPSDQWRNNWPMDDIREYDFAEAEYGREAPRWGGTPNKHKIILMSQILRTMSHAGGQPFRL